YVFADSRYAALRRALEDGRFQALTNAACFAEFARVLDYPQFGLAPERREQALASYRRHAASVAATPAQPVPLPRCKDPDDQKFLELARDGQAACLVTSDKALLKLARRRRLAPLFRIVTPDAAVQALPE
ncbi:MAG: PIN domain-containing protein, partial [Rhodocyclales bacterium]|nr:PIN domain-containing protein [Rhodocyclales bacterium]